MVRQSIFISIAGFCDPYLRFTIESAFSQSSDPDSLVVGVVDQSPASLATWLAGRPFADQVRYLHIDPLHSRGVCWARHLAQSLYDDEALFLQVDSHTWFQDQWDRLLRDHLSRLLKVSQKPVLTIYPPGFEFDGTGQPITRRAPSQSVSFFEPKPDQVLTPEDPVLTFRAGFRPPPAQPDGSDDTVWHYTRGSHLAGGFLFTLGEFVKQVPYDPGFYFHGEEQGLAVRAFTHGWDLFHPQFHRVPICHLYKMPASASPNLHWRQDLEARRSVKWPERRRRATQRFNALLAGRLESPYALGQQRTLTEFCCISGLDYPNCTISRPQIRLFGA